MVVYLEQGLWADDAIEYILWSRSSVGEVEFDCALFIQLFDVQNVGVLDSVTAKEPGVMIAIDLRHVPADRLLMGGEELFDVEPVDKLAMSVAEVAPVRLYPAQNGPVRYAIKDKLSTLSSLSAGVQPVAYRPGNQIPELHKTNLLDNSAAPAIFIAIAREHNRRLLLRS